MSKHKADEEGARRKITHSEEARRRTNEVISSNETGPTDIATDDSSTTETSPIKKVDSLPTDNTCGNEPETVKGGSDQTNGIDNDPNGKPSDKSQTEDAPSDNQQNNEDPIGYEGSKFSKLGDEQDKEISEEIKSGKLNEEKKKDKKKRDKYVLGPRTVPVRPTDGELSKRILGPRTVEERRKHNMERIQIFGPRTVRRRSLLQLLSQDLVPSFDSRILVVGAYEAGKTTLVSNLIGKAIPRERQSTDGIDVYFGKLLFDLKKQKLLKKTKGVHSFPKAIYQKILSYRNSVKNEDAIPGKTQPDVPNDDVLQELSVRINEYEDAESTELNVDQEVIPIPVLDFAGQIVYHATHQTFITSHGIYIITFNGSKELDAPLSDREDERKTTILENIRQWVSSILLYSHPDNKDYPKLMFVATHKDLVCQQDVPNKRAQLLNTLSACFADGDIKSHMLLQKLFFVNGLSKNDPEMEELRECISRTITENPQWGQMVPKQFLILEMMFAALVEEGKIIITLEDAEKINTTTGVKPLSTAELGLFLGVQNICGKMTYIDHPQLRNYIVIDPTCLIDVLKSIVTSVPIIASLHQGRLTTSELTNIWSSEKFSHFLQHEEYFRQLLVHYDILSEVRRYDRESGKKIDVDRYLVPCMITTQNTTTFVEKHLTSGKCISFAFEFSATDVPDAIPCRLISSILSIWNVKSYENVDLLFSGFVAVVLDRKHDLVVKTEHNTVAVYIVHKDRKELIIKDLASCVIEVLKQNLAKISEVYSLSFKSDNITQRYVPFHVKLKSGCLSPNCLLDAEDVHSIETYWVCDDHRYITPKSELEIWYTDRTNLQCTDSCQEVACADWNLSSRHLLIKLRYTRCCSVDATQRLATSSHLQQLDKRRSTQLGIQPWGLEYSTGCN